MSSLPAQLPPAPSPEPVFRLSVEQYHAMIDAGVLTDDDPVELLEGVLVFKMPKKPKHRYVVQTAQDVIRAMLPANWFYQAQEPITLEDGEPEPDGVIVQGSQMDYRSRHPGPANIALLIEVADTTLARDRGVKLRSYARAGIPIYWIIDLLGRSIEVYTAPDSSGAEPTYKHKLVFDEKATISVQLDGKTIGDIPVASLLP